MYASHCINVLLFLAVCDTNCTYNVRQLLMLHSVVEVEKALFHYFRVDRIIMHCYQKLLQNRCLDFISAETDNFIRLCKRFHFFLNFLFWASNVYFLFRQMNWGNNNDDNLWNSNFDLSEALTASTTSTNKVVWILFFAVATVALGDWTPASLLAEQAQWVHVNSHPRSAGMLSTPGSPNKTIGQGHDHHPPKDITSDLEHFQDPRLLLHYFQLISCPFQLLVKLS